MTRIDIMFLTETRETEMMGSRTASADIMRKEDMWAVVTLMKEDHWVMMMMTVKIMWTRVVFLKVTSTSKTGVMIMTGMTIEVALLVVVTGTRVVVLNDDGGRPLSDSDDRDAGVRRDDKDNVERCRARRTGC